MLDSNLIFTDDLTLNADGQSSILDLGKTGVDGVWVALISKTLATGTSPTLDAKIQYSDSATFASGVEDGPAFEQLTDANTPYRRHLLVQTKRRYARFDYVITGTTPVFANMTTAVVSGPQRDDTA